MSRSRNLSDMVDDVVATLRRCNPTWIGPYGDGLGAQVAAMLHDGRIHAQEAAEREGEEEGYWESGGIRVVHNIVGDFTTVYVAIGTEEHSPDEDGAP